MRKKTFIAIVVAASAVLIGIKAHAFTEGDFQIWHTEDQEVNIFKKTKFTMQEEFRYGDDSSHLYYHHYDWGFVYEICKNFNMGANYRQVYDLKKGKFMEENRPHINGTIKWDLWGFACEDRNRFEYRHFRYQDDYVQYRNKFTIKLPWKFTEFGIQPYFSDEVFANLNKALLHRNRFYAGLGISLNKNLKGDIYYMLQSSKGSNKWTDVNVLGLKLKLSF